MRCLSLAVGGPASVSTMQKMVATLHSGLIMKLSFHGTRLKAGEPGREA